MGKLTDNLMKCIVAVNAMNGIAPATPVSHDIDFDLPRGYVAKIKKLVYYSLGPDMDVTADEDMNQNMQSALVNDSDDSTTSQAPTDTPNHDVIMDWNHRVNYETRAAALEIQYYSRDNESPVITNFEDDLDVIAARNMKFNTSVGQQKSKNRSARLLVFYTLEKVDSKIMLELLDIL